MEKKYTLILFGLGLSIVLFVVIIFMGNIGLFPRQFMEEFIVLIPDIPGIPGIISDLIILYLLPVLMVLIVILISPLMIKFFYKIHRVINRHPKYGIINLEERKPKFYYLFFRVFVVGLFAFSLMSILMEFGFGLVFRDYTAGLGQGWELVFKAEAAFLGTYFLAPFILLIFVPLWIMEDSGLISYKSFSDQRRAPDIEGMHTTYSHLLEAYSGVSTLLILFTYVYEASSVVFTKPEDFFPNLMSFISIMVLPITITGIFAFGVFLYEKYIDKTRERIQKAMLDEGFIRINIPEMEELKV